MTDQYGNRNGYAQTHGDAPAFPVSVPGCGDNGLHGMSLRDWFAGLAMQSIYATALNTDRLATEAYAIADAMLSERVAVTAGKSGP